MGIEISGSPRDANVLLLIGLGMRPFNPGVEWIAERFSSAGLNPAVVAFPTEFSDVTEELVAPAMDVERLMGDHVLVGFSLGGLVGSFLQGARRRFFLSPFWGINDVLSRMGFDLRLKRLKNVNYRLLPRLYTLRDAGPFAVEGDLSTIPEWISVSALSAMVRAQDTMPSLRDDDVVYLSPQDLLVSQETARKIGIEIRTYEGGHMIHLVRDREAILDSIIRDIRGSLHQERY